MLEGLKEEVFKANLLLPKYNLVVFSWGNVSGIDRDSGLVVIKPSGVEYSDLSPSDMVVVDLDGNVVEGKLRPSSDTPTHVELYKAFPDIGGVTHTHSKWATTYAQAGLDIVPLGTTHSDYFHGAIPCTRVLSEAEVAGLYEKNTGLVITEEFADKDYNAIPGVLVRTHGPFTWGKNPYESVHNSAVLEQLAFMNWHQEALSDEIELCPQYIMDKHYHRKHGKNAYYGQKK